MSATPLVSVAMSALNAEQTIAAAIRSILRQTYVHWELILIDDGSTDATLSVARSMKDSRIRVVADGTNRGLAARLDQAVSMARGKYIARMDPDDVSCPQRFSRQVEYLEANPDIDLLGTGAVVFEGNGEPIGLYPVRRAHQEICAAPWSGFLLAHPTWMGRRQWFLKYGYRKDAIRMEDKDLLLRSWRDSRFAGLDEALIGYRQGNPPARNILLGRYHYSVALWRQYRDSGNFLFTLRGLATQCWRGAVALVLIALGQGRLLLRRRYRALSAEQAEAWRQCWRALQDSDPS